MHDVLRQRLLRKIESLPDEQVYQVLDYIEFRESKYVTAEGVSTSGLQKFAEGLEDKLRRRAVSPNTIREAFQLISAADRVLSGVSSAGRQILDDLGQALEVEEGATAPTGQSPADDDAQRIEADPRRRRAGARGSSPGGGAQGASVSPSEGMGGSRTQGTQGASSHGSSDPVRRETGGGRPSRDASDHGSAGSDGASPEKPGS